MKTNTLLVLLIIFFGCEENDNNSNPEFRNYTGTYDIVSFKSDIAVDLNNDNILSKELTNEIDSFGDYFFGDLYIRPDNDGFDDVKFISFTFPKTKISFKPLLYPEGDVSFIGFGHSCFYEFESGQFILEDKQYIEYAYIDNVESNRTVYLDSELIVKDSTHLELKLRKEFYDFDTTQWLMLNIDIQYKKRNEEITSHQK